MLASTRTVSTLVILVTLLLVTTVLAAAAVAELPASCDAPRTLASRDVVRSGAAGAAGEEHCYRLDLASWGLLGLQASAGHRPSGVRLEVFDRDGRPAVLDTVFRSVGERLALTPTGSYFVTVRGEDPEADLPPYRLAARFVDLAKSETDGEIEIEPEELPAACRPEPLSLLCRAGAEADDHADDFACATPVRRHATGELGNAWGDDADVFRFSLRRWQSVQISVRGDLDALVSLYDGDGQRLDSSAVTGGTSRLVRTLRPGAYYVRLESESSAGAYTVSMHRLDL